MDLDERNEKKYLKYEKTSLICALNEIKVNGLAIATASKQFKIPYSTLRLKIQDREKEEKKKRGPSTVLTANEELKLANWIEDCAKMGQPITKKQLFDAALKISKTHNNPASSFGTNGKINFQHPFLLLHFSF
jgi:hypothetical protein